MHRTPAFASSDSFVLTQTFMKTQPAREPADFNATAIHHPVVTESISYHQCGKCLQLHACKFQTRVSSTFVFQCPAARNHSGKSTFLFLKVFAFHINVALSGSGTG